MLQILGYIFLIAIVILLLKFGFALLIRCCAIGILAFFGVGFVTGALSILGFMNFSTAWTLSKWAFYIGTAINVIEALFHPFTAISQAWDLANDDSDYSSSSYDDSYNHQHRQKNNDYEEDNDLYSGVRCCGNCRFNHSAYRNGVSCNHSPAGEYNDVMDSCSDYMHM